MKQDISTVYNDALTGVTYWLKHRKQLCYRCRRKGHLANDCDKICPLCENLHSTPVCLHELNKIFDKILKRIDQIDQQEKVLQAHEEALKILNKEHKNELKEMQKSLKQIKDSSFNMPSRAESFTLNRLEPNKNEIQIPKIILSSENASKLSLMATPKPAKINFNSFLDFFNYSREVYEQRKIMDQAYKKYVSTHTMHPIITMREVKWVKIDSWIYQGMSIGLLQKMSVDVSPYTKKIYSVLWPSKRDILWVSPSFSISPCRQFSNLNQAKQLEIKTLAHRISTMKANMARYKSNLQSIVQYVKEFYQNRDKIKEEMAKEKQYLNALKTATSDLILPVKQAITQLDQMVDTKRKGVLKEITEIRRQAALKIRKKMEIKKKKQEERQAYERMKKEVSRELYKKKSNVRTSRIKPGKYNNHEISLKRSEGNQTNGKQNLRKSKK
jgi:hypothetical protein